MRFENLYSGVILCSNTKLQIVGNITKKGCTRLIIFNNDYNY